MKIGFAITSSYCTVEKIMEQIVNLVEMGYDVIPIASPGVVSCDTRFGEGYKFKEVLEKITGNNVVSTIVDAERFGPKEKLDLLVIAPATGNSIAKLAYGITDTPVTMATKATLRNGSPIVIGVSTNDGLGANGANIMKLLNTKNIFFIPFGQDDYVKKPNSLISHFDMLIPTIEEALNNNQIQPVLQDYKKK
ncbi:MAG: dipicolinate synthase subunit B [Bacilli bacterium]|nr:dipicolinate synthase subunit B [Bacilli bacterium]